MRRFFQWIGIYHHGTRQNSQEKRALTFKYEDFKLYKRNALRPCVTFQQLLHEEKNTKDAVQEALWLCSQIVKRMVTTVFSDAIINGTKSWDAKLSGCLSLTLQAALASRAGDIKRSCYYTGVQYLKWKDIELVAKGSSITEPSLLLLITLLYRKSNK